jgi:purine-cytosine permease-like protein
MDNDMAAVFGVLGLASIVALLIGFSTWILSRRRQERAREQVDIQRRILEKFGSAGEFVAFLESGAGRKFLAAVSSEAGAQAHRIFGSIQKGAICTLIGVVGFCVVLFGHEDLEPLAVPSGIVLAIGLGYLISAFASYRLSKQWGLLPPSAP